MGVRITGTQPKPRRRGCLRRAAVGAAVVTGATVVLTIALAVGVVGALWLFSWVSI